MEQKKKEEKEQEACNPSRLAFIKTNTARHLSDLHKRGRSNLPARCSDVPGFLLERQVWSEAEGVTPRSRSASFYYSLKVYWHTLGQEVSHAAQPLCVTKGQCVCTVLFTAGWTVNNVCWCSAGKEAWNICWGGIRWRRLQEEGNLVNKWTNFQTNTDGERWENQRLCWSLAELCLDWCWSKESFAHLGQLNWTSFILLWRVKRQLTLTPTTSLVTESSGVYQLLLGLIHSAPPWLSEGPVVAEVRHVQRVQRASLRTSEGIFQDDEGKLSCEWESDITHSFNYTSQRVQRAPLDGCVCACASPPLFDFEVVTFCQEQEPRAGGGKTELYHLRVGGIFLSARKFVRQNSLESLPSPVCANPHAEMKNLFFYIKLSSQVFLYGARSVSKFTDCSRKLFLFWTYTIGIQDSAHSPSVCLNLPNPKLWYVRSEGLPDFMTQPYHDFEFVSVQFKGRLLTNEAVTLHLLVITCSASCVTLKSPVLFAYFSECVDLCHPFRISHTRITRTQIRISFKSISSPPYRCLSSATICGAGSCMLRWHHSGSHWPFVAWLQGFLQLVKRFWSASLCVSVLSSVSSAAQINELTSPQDVSQCK